LEEQAWRDLTRQAESLAAETLAAELELASNPKLHETLGLSPKIQSALTRCDPMRIPVGAARVMRFDFHFTAQGWRISEANTDVPGGFIEAAGFTRLMVEHFPGCLPPPDVAEIYAEAIHRVAGQRATVALIHATVYSDDRQVMQYLANHLQTRGLHPILLSPAHLRWKDGRAEVPSAASASSPALLVRFFPADWLPNLAASSNWQPWFIGGKTPMSNPATALLTQSKRFPLTWKYLRTPLPTWKSLLPESVSPRDLPGVPCREWIFKPAFGRVGEDILMPGVTPAGQREKLLRDAARHPRDWVAQHRFESIPVASPAGPRHACLGVFTVDSRAAGIYARISAKPLIDQNAQDIAVLLAPQEVRHALG
jgi:glutathionylspermidine synthase